MANWRHTGLGAADEELHRAVEYLLDPARGRPLMLRAQRIKHRRVVPAPALTSRVVEREAVYEGLLVPLDFPPAHVRRAILGKPVNLNRGEAQDVLAHFARQNPKYRESLIRDPKAVIAKQFNRFLPKNVVVKAVVESADTLYVIVPHVARESELMDADLEKVAGGKALDFTCIGGAPNSLNQMF